MQASTKHTISALISFLLILLFVYTAVNKLLEQEKFLISLRRSPILQPYGQWLVYLVPLIELGIALALIIPSIRRWGLLFSIILLAVFTLYIGWMLVFMEHLPCSCGGVISTLSWKEHLVFNGCFLLAGIYGYLLSNQNKLT